MAGPAGVLVQAAVVETISGASGAIVPTMSPTVASSTPAAVSAAGGDESIVNLDDVEVPKDSLVGTFNQGFGVALQGVGLDD